MAAPIPTTDRPETPAGQLERLVDLISTLRGPDGCPWDRQQTLPDVRAHLLEEAHEVIAALDADDWSALAEELGDLAFQLVFACELARDRGAFELSSVLQGVTDKMIERHPHVFGDERLDDARAVARAWQERKATSTSAAASDHERTSGRRAGLLDGLPDTLPALTAAQRMGEKATGIGFDWPDAQSALAKVREELGELEAEMVTDGAHRRAARQEELGDLLQAIAQLARHLDIDAEAALARANRKFRHRFGVVEQRLTAETIELPSDPAARLDLLEALWQQAKQGTP